MRIIKTMFFALVLMSFFILSKVNALEMKSSNIVANNISGYDRVSNGSYLKDNVNLATNQDFSFTLTGSNNIEGYDYLTFGFQFNFNLNGYEYTTTSGTQSESTGTPEYRCTSYGTGYTNYSDGTQSTFTFCERWEQWDSEQNTYITSSNSTTESHYRPDIGLSIYAIYNNGSFSPCEVNSINYGNTFVTCKIPNGATNFTSIRFRSVGSSYYTSLPSTIGIQTYWSAWKDPMSLINGSISSGNQQAHQDAQDINNSINNNNVSGANTDANSFVNNQAFQDNTGLTSVITAPLSVVNSLTATCSPIRLTLPYIDTNIDLPCIGSLLEQKVGALAQLIKVVVNGFICYIIGVDLFRIVKEARNPDDDRIEVLDL